MRTVLTSIFLLWSLTCHLFSQSAQLEGDDSFKEKVVLIKVGEKDLVNDQSFKFWRKTLKRVNEENAKAVIFELNTPGGLAIETKEIMVNEMRDLEVPSFAFVNDEAISAGAMISIATDAIYMKPGSLIGAAGLISGNGQEIENVMRQKLESFFDATIRSVTNDKGYPEEIVQMMMFIDEEEDRSYGPVTTKKGRLLTLTAEEAVQLHNEKTVLAKGLADTVEEILEKEGLAEFPIIVAEVKGFEKIAWWIKYFAPVLIVIGIGAAYFELQSPGMGIGGAIAALAFGVFFFGNNVAGNLAGYELVAVFILGLILIIVEVFVFPTIIGGIAGVLLMLGSLLFAMVDKFELKDIKVEGDGVDFSAFFAALELPIISLGIGLIGSIFVVIALMKALPKIPMRGLVLQSSVGPVSSVESSEIQEGAAETLTGEALTDLRPAGKVLVGKKIVDAITRGEFIAKGEAIEIVAEEQMRTIVQKRS